MWQAVSSIQLGTRQADAPQVLEDRHLGVNVVEDHLGAVEVEAQGAVKGGGQGREVGLGLIPDVDGGGSHGRVETANCRRLWYVRMSGSI